MVKESKVSSWKGFLMTLAATTVSIVLTFGTSAVTDKDLEVFSVERQKLLEASVADSGAEGGAQIGRSMNQRKEQLRKAREAGRKELNQ